VEKRLERLEDKLDSVAEQLSAIDKTLITNTVILEEHQRRSLANEKAVQLLEAQVLPISQHVHTMSVFGKIVLAIISSGVGLFLLQKVIALIS
jgi:hypothetical protein